MTDTDSTAGEPAEPAELPIGLPIEPGVLPTGHEETPAQQKEFDLGFEYFHKLAELETDLNGLNEDIRSLKRPIENPEKNLDRVLQRKELENKAAEVERRIAAIKDWFATKPASLDGIPTDTAPLPANKKAIAASYRVGADKTNKPYRDAKTAAINAAKTLFTSENTLTKDDIVETIGGILASEGYTLPSYRKIWEYVKGAHQRKELTIPAALQKPGRKSRKD